jgi:hypothetical protein
MIPYLTSGFGDEPQQDSQDVPPEQQQAQSFQQQREEESEAFQEYSAENPIPAAVWGTAGAERVATVKQGSTVASKKHKVSPSKQQNNSKKKARTSEGINTEEEKDVIETLGDAMELCKKLVDSQLKLAKELNADMNTSVSGDARVKNTILTLLPNELIREVFIYATGDKFALSRIRTLFGAPPFHFLKPEDFGLFRASGFAPGRSNMAYGGDHLSALDTVNYSQFGTSHLVDSYKREYKIVSAVNLQMSDKLVFDIDSLEVSKPVHLNVRVPKRTQDDKIKLFKNLETRRSLFFPQVGEIINAKYSTTLQSVWKGNPYKDEYLRILVKALTPRSVSGSTASVIGIRL